MNRYYCKTGKPNIYTKVRLVPGGALVEVCVLACINQLKASLRCRLLNKFGRGCLSNKKG